MPAAASEMLLQGKAFFLFLDESHASHFWYPPLRRIPFLTVGLVAIIVAVEFQNQRLAKRLVSSSTYTSAVALNSSDAAEAAAAAAASSLWNFKSFFLTFPSDLLLPALKGEQGAEESGDCKSSQQNSVSSFLLRLLLPALPLETSSPAATFFKVATFAAACAGAELRFGSFCAAALALSGAAAALSASLWTQALFACPSEKLPSNLPLVGCGGGASAALAVLFSTPFVSPPKAESGGKGFCVGKGALRRTTALAPRLPLPATFLVASVAVDAAAATQEAFFSSARQARPGRGGETAGEDLRLRGSRLCTEGNGTPPQKQRAKGTEEERGAGEEVAELSLKGAFERAKNEYSSQVQEALLAEAEAAAASLFFLEGKHRQARRLQSLAANRHSESAVVSAEASVSGSFFLPFSFCSFLFLGLALCLCASRLQRADGSVFGFWLCGRPAKRAKHKRRREPVRVGGQWGRERFSSSQPSVRRRAFRQQQQRLPPPDSLCWPSVYFLQPLPSPFTWTSRSWCRSSLEVEARNRGGGGG